MGDNTCGVLEMPSDQFDPKGKEIHKFLLENEEDFHLPFLSNFVSIYITLDIRAEQDDAMLYDYIIRSFSFNGLVKVLIRSETITGENEKLEYC